MSTSSPNKVTRQIAVNGGTEAMVYGRYRGAGYATEPVALRAGGVIVPESVSAHDALAMGDLGFTAEKRPLAFMGQDGWVADPNHCTIVRSDRDTLLGTFKSTYEVLQHNTLATVLERLGDRATIEQVLSIRDGRKAYVTARIATGSVGGDPVVRHLHLFNSHDGSAAFGALFTDTRLYCANQLGTITRGRNSETLLRHPHTAGITRFAEQLVTRIDLETGRFLTECEALARLRRCPTTKELTERILRATFADELARPVKDRKSGEARERTVEDLQYRDAIRSHFLSDSGLGTESEECRYSVYRLFNSITQALTHDQPRNAANQIEQARARFESLMGGTAATRINRAREACLACA
jgi:hypothetical protein